MDTKENFNTNIKSVKESLSFDHSVSEVLGDLVESVTSISGQLVYRCELDKLIQTLTILKSNEKLDFSQLTDITAVDYPERLFRFELVSVYENLFFTLLNIVEQDFRRWGHLGQTPTAACRLQCAASISNILAFWGEFVHFW